MLTGTNYRVAKTSHGRTILGRVISREALIMEAAIREQRPRRWNRQCAPEYIFKAPRAKIVEKIYIIVISMAAFRRLHGRCPEAQIGRKCL